MSHNMKFVNKITVKINYKKSRRECQCKKYRILRFEKNYLINMYCNTIVKMHKKTKKTEEFLRKIEEYCMLINFIIVIIYHVTYSYQTKH